MRIPRNWETWAIAAGLLAVVLWYATSGPESNWPAGTEDLDMLSHPLGLPSEFMHWSPVSWAGRKHPYPSSYCGQIGALVNRQLPDYADMDG
jgi:hypothetical protein